MKLFLKDIIHKNKQELEKEQERVEREIKNLEESNEAQYKYNSLQEVEIESRAEDAEIQESNISIRNTLVEHLAQVKHALSRIRKNKYGYCVRCKNPISPQRLAANPATIYCLECAEFIERENEAA